MRASYNREVFDWQIKKGEALYSVKLTDLKAQD
jgi:hypothetical protein